MEKNYAILRLSKLKSGSKLRIAHSHNMRLYNVQNADPSIENTELISCGLKNYEEIQKEYLSELKAEGVPEYTVRKDAVLGFELILTTSKGLPPEKQKEWEKANIEWLNDYFNPPNKEAVVLDKNGEEIKIRTDNVKHAVVHNDEQTPHIHAFIIPIDERGRLNAKSYTSGKYAMQAMQSSYAKAMKEFGLSRGVRGTMSSHQDIQYFYSLQNSILKAELPSVEKGETALEYKQRADQIYKKALAVNYKQNEDIKRERNEMQEERKEIKSLLRQGSPYELEREIKETRRFKKGIEEYPQKDYANDAQKKYKHIVDWERQNEIEEKKKEKEREREWDW